MIEECTMSLSVGRNLLFASFLSAAVLALGVETARADSTPVTHCGQELSQAGDYHLAQDLGPCTGYGVVITASDVRFTLAGHTISGVSSQASCDLNNPQTGVDVRNPATGVRVSGGTVTGFVDGVIVTSGSRVTAMRVLDNCEFGILVYGTGGRVDTSIVTGSDDGILLCEAQRAVVTANEVFGNARYGVLLSCGVDANDGNHVVNNILRDNGLPAGDGGGLGIFAGNDHRIVGNAVAGNFMGMHLLSTTQTVIRDNTVNGNLTEGIVLTNLAHGNVVRANTAYHNGQTDLQDDNPRCDSNTWRRNLFLTDMVAGLPNGGPNAGCLR
jgi:parallel beta-helix repeat protein